MHIMSFTLSFYNVLLKVPYTGLPQQNRPYEDNSKQKTHKSQHSVPQKIRTRLTDLITTRMQCGTRDRSSSGRAPANVTLHPAARVSGATSHGAGERSTQYWGRSHRSASEMRQTPQSSGGRPSESLPDFSTEVVSTKQPTNPPGEDFSPSTPAMGDRPGNIPGANTTPQNGRFVQCSLTPRPCPSTAQDIRVLRAVGAQTRVPCTCGSGGNKQVLRALTASHDPDIPA